MTTLHATMINKLQNKTIESINFGHDRCPGNSYGVLTIKTDEGTFVLSCSMLYSEICIWEEDRRK